MHNTSVGGGLAGAVIDALTSHICVVDPEGVIFAVNRAWKEFAASNSGGQAQDHIGVSYLNVCRNSVGAASEEAPMFANGLSAVLRGEREFFQIEYPCHSPKELRWFLARVSPLRDRSSSTQEGNMGAVVSHMNVTERKLVELEFAKLAATDPLTGIPNRRFFEDFAKLDMDRVLRFGDPSSLLMVDLDNFKSINDTYGHAAGDEVLRCVASLGKTVFRSCDLFARLGGEEFVCLLAGTDEWGAIMAAEKLRAAIERLSIVSGANLISVTASIGISSIIKEDVTLDSALLRADKALYRAKDDGRNCVRTFATTLLLDEPSVKHGARQMSNDNSLSRPELDDRIAILQDNIRQLVEQAAGRSGGQTEERNSDRIAQQREQLDRLTKERDALLQK